MAIALGLAVALVYGAADFIGGHTARGNHPLVVVAMSQGTGLVAIVALVVIDGAPVPGLGALGFGAASGLAGLVGVLLLYRGLAAGSMGIIAPITAIGAAVIPLAWGLARGERPTTLAYVGILAALVAVALIASVVPAGSGAVPGVRTSRPELLLAIAAGVAFGVGLILLAEAGGEPGFWPILAARSVAVPTAFAVAALLGLRPVLTPGSRTAVTAIGLLDVLAVSLYLVATRRGLLSLVAVLGSLSPATTVLLARVVLHERLVALQVVGLVLGLAGVVLITV